MCNSLQLFRSQLCLHFHIQGLEPGRGLSAVDTSECRYLHSIYTVSTQYLHSTHWTHTCVVLLAGGWAGGGTVIAARRVSPPPPRHWSPGTWPAQLASSRLQTPARRLHWAEQIWVNADIHVISHIHHFASTLSIPLFVCSGNAGISVLTSTKKYIQHTCIIKVMQF